MSVNMNKEWALLLIVFLPLLGAAFLPFVGLVWAKARNLAAFILVVASCALSGSIASSVVSGQIINITLPFPLGFNFVFNADGLAVFMALVSSFISAVIIVYSFDYISHYKHQQEYYSMVVLFLGAMMGLIFSANLIFLYIFWEITSITSWRLIGFFREKKDVLRADKAFLVTVFGALVMLLGFIKLYLETGSFDLSAIQAAARVNPVSNLAIALILVGIFAKSATLPLHTWLPDAGVAPSPVTALLHAAVLVKIGVYVFARLFVVTMPLALPWQTFVAIIAGISALVSGGAALIDTDLKRIIAYSTVSQIGFIFLGFAMGCEIGVAGSLLYILMHGISKAGLFLCAGIVEHNTKTKDITQLGGLIRTMPVTAVSFLLCAFSVMGIPPFGGFFSKYMVIAGTLQDGRLMIAAVFLFGALLTILYLLRVFSMVFLGEEKKSFAKEGSGLMVFCVALFAFISLIGGIFVQYPNQMLQAILPQIIGLR